MKGWTISSLLWTIAYVGLGLASVATPAGPRGIQGILIGGGLIWFATYLADRRTQPDRRRGSGRAIAWTAFVTAIVELAAAAAGWAESGETWALLFGIGAGFALAAWAGAMRRKPSQGVILVQVAFQGPFLIPAIGTLIHLGVSAVGGPETDPGPVVEIFLLIAAIACFVVLVVSLIAMDRTNILPRGDRPSCALLLAEATFLVAMARWVLGALREI